MNKDKISIILPVYNVEDDLRHCLYTVIAQTYKHLEIILVDDGSLDYSPQICDEYALLDNRIRVIHKNNEGLGLARNSGLEVATGKYVLFIDSDDYVDVNFVKVLYDKIIEYKSDTVFCGFNRVYPNGIIKKAPGFYNEAHFKGDDVISNILLEMIGTTPKDKVDRNLPMSVWHALYSIDIINSYNIRFPSEKEFMSEDIGFHIDYLRYAKCVTYISDCLYFYRFNPVSLSKSYDPNRFERYKEMHTEIIKRLSIFLKENQYLERIQRMFLGGVRGSVMDIVKFEEIDQLNKIKRICQDDIVVDTLITYPFNKNPFDQKVFNWCIKHKLSYFLYLLAKLQIKKTGKLDN